MTHGTSSLRCPNCGQDFLSLQQRTDSPETCPHCSYSTVLAEFLAASPPSPPSATPAAPLLRRIVRSQPQPAPPPAMPGYQAQPSPFHNAPRPASPFQAAPQQPRPAPAPQGLDSLFTPPSPATPPPTASPFGLASANKPPPAKQAPEPTLQFPEVPGLLTESKPPPKTVRPKPQAHPFPPAPENPPPQAPPAPSPAPEAWPSPPSRVSPFASPESLPWPGLQKSGTPAHGGTAPTRDEHLPPRNPRAELPRSYPVPEPSPEPARPATPKTGVRRDTPLLPVRTIDTESTPAGPVAESGLGAGGFIAALFLASVIGLSAWLFTQNQDEAWTFRFPAPSPTPPSKAPPAAPSPTAPPSVTEEVRRAAPVPETTPGNPPVPKPVNDLREAAAAVPDLVRRLFEAGTATGRAACIAEPERYSDEVESFFAATEGRSRPGFTELQQFTAVPFTLPGAEQTTLFQVKTDANPGGALLRPIRQSDGTWRIHWPLFHETHERRLESYLQNPDDEPRWFHIGLRANHGFDVPDELRETHFVYDLQGSADNSTRVIALADKNTPLGRYLKREVEWGEIYLARVLLRWTQFTPEAEGLALIDCDGMTEAAADAP